LESKEFNTFFTEWNSSELVKETTRRGKKTKVLTPLTFSLLHATDFANRLYHQILPPLKAGMIVLADRYMYTAFARDAVRGMSPGWLRNLYSFAVRPDLVFYFRVPIEVSVSRLLGGTRADLKYYEAGMDLGLSSNVIESFKIFQSQALAEYDKLVDEFGLTVIDATLEIDEQQDHVRDIVSKSLSSYKPKRGTHGRREALFWRRFTIPQSDRP
jgi:dTMP kinase